MRGQMSSRQWDALEADYRPPHPASEGTCISRQSGGTPKHGPCLLHAYFPDAALKLRRAVLGSRRAEGLAWLCGPREDEHSTAQRIKPARVRGGGAACVWPSVKAFLLGCGLGWGGGAQLGASQGWWWLWQNSHSPFPPRLGGVTQHHREGGPRSW